MLLCSRSVFPSAPSDAVNRSRRAFGTLSPLTILMLLLSLSNVPCDLVSLVDPEDYFRSREIAVKPERMVELVSSAPASNKERIGQLLAIRWLAEHPPEAKQTTGARAALEALAAGKKVSDVHGFARVYAQRALAQIAGKLPASTGTDPLVSTLSWFPATVNVVAGVDLHGEVGRIEPHPLSRLILAQMPKDREEFYKVVDTLGNIRMDRIAVGAEVNAGRFKRVFVRITGAGDLQALVDFLGRTLPDGKSLEEKGPQGERILILTSEKAAVMAAAFVGDNDVILTGSNDVKENLTALRRALAVRAGTGANVTTGPLADLLRQVPVRATAFAAGELDEQTQMAMRKGDTPFSAIPRRILVTLAVEKGFAFQAQTRFKNAEEAKAFVADVEKLRKLGTDALKNPPQDVPVDAPPLLTRLLTDLRLEASEDGVKGSLDIAPETVKGLRDLLENLLKQTRGQAPERPKP